MIRSAIIALDASPFAEQVGGWLPDLARAGMRRATLFHAIESGAERCATELDALRPWLDHLAVQMSAAGVETEVALKRGDRLRWMLSLVALHGADLVVIGARCSVQPDAGPVGSLLSPLLEECPVPILVVTGAKAANDDWLFSAPELLDSDDLFEAARNLMPQATVKRSQGGAGAAEASLVITRPGASGTTVHDAIARARCPVLVFPSPAPQRSPANT